LNANDWHERKAEGWVWFEEEKKSDKDQPIREKSYQEGRDPEKELDAFKRDFERKLKIATWDPTPENVLAFQKMQFIALEKSVEFGRVWQQNLLANPYLDSTIHSLPSSQYGNEIQKHIYQQEKEAFLRSLAKEHGLLFFYQGLKLTSQASAEIIRNFANKYDFKLYGVAVDETIIAEIENQASAKNLIEQFNISIFPSLYIVDPENNRLYPIAYGMVSQDKIEENILLQLSKRG